MGKPENIVTFIDRHIFENGMSGYDAFRILNLFKDYGILMSVKDFAEQNNKSVQAIYRYKKTKEWMGIKLVIDEKDE